MYKTVIYPENHKYYVYLNFSQFPFSKLKFGENYIFPNLNIKQDLSHLLINTVQNNSLSYFQQYYTEYVQFLLWQGRYHSVALRSAYCFIFNNMKC